MHINVCSLNDDKKIEDLRLNAAGGRFLPDLHSELADLSQQLSDCVDLWTSYFTLTQTTYYRWNRIRVLYRKKTLTNEDLSENQQCLIKLQRTVLCSRDEHQQAMNRLLDYYIEKSNRGDELSTFVPYVNSDQAESIFVAISAMHYSTIQLAQAVMALGTTIHIVFELETTAVYRFFNRPKFNEKK
jgi:hypothetical protein